MSETTDTACTSGESVSVADASPPGSSPGQRWKRGLLRAAGVISTILALAGVLLPLVPTTPFLLVAVACFARSSPRLHQRLIANRRFGPFLERWERERTVPRKAKQKAYLLVILSFGISIALVRALWLRVAIAALGCALLVFLARLPTTRDQSESIPSSRR